MKIIKSEKHMKIQEGELAIELYLGEKEWEILWGSYGTQNVLKTISFVELLAKAIEVATEENKKI